MDKVFAAYEKEVEFYTVYIREAHPTDGWRLSFNDQFGIKATQPKSFDERLNLANQCSSSLQLLCPMLVDGLDDKVSKAYAAFPDRLYLIDRDGKIAYKGGRGPFGYKPRELERSIVMLLLEQRLADEKVDSKPRAEGKKEPRAETQGRRETEGKEQAEQEQAEEEQAKKEQAKTAEAKKEQAEEEQAEKEQAEKAQAEKEHAQAE